MQNNIIAYNNLIGRGVTRLCHFTKIKSLVHILTSETGILATDFVDKGILQQNDIGRYDNATNYVCCSIEYPNSWFWEKAKNRDDDKVFKEWAIITIDLDILKMRKFKFSGCNAATNSGQWIREDAENILYLFAERIPTWQYPRNASMLNCCPTNGQTELLVYKNIPLNLISSIIVGDEENANHIGAILKTCGLQLPVFIAPNVCNTSWSQQVRNGYRPQETEYTC